MEKKKVAVPLVCHGHSRPVVDLFYSPVTPDGFFLISASKGTFCGFRFYVFIFYGSGFDLFIAMIKIRVCSLGCYFGM